VYGENLKAYLQSVERVRKQIHIQLFEDLTVYIKILHNALVYLQSQNTQVEQVSQKLQQKLKIIMELYLQSGIDLNRKSIVEENYELEKEEELCKMVENISHADEDLESYRNLE
jgi:hypothetical protein